MTRLGCSFCLGAALAAAPLPATASQETAAVNVCRAIARIADAARERPAFRSIRDALAGGQSIVPGFGAAECVATADGVECRSRQPQSAFRGWPDLASCPGVSPLPPLSPRRRMAWPSNRSYRFGRLLVERGYRCPGCRALGPSWFSMTFYRPVEPD